MWARSGLGRDDTLLFRVVRDDGRNRSLVRLDRQRVRLVLGIVMKGVGRLDAASSARSLSTMPLSMMGAPASTFTPPRRRGSKARYALMARAFRPALSFGRSGGCTSPAEVTVVMPPCIVLSIQPISFSWGVTSRRTPGAPGCGSAGARRRSAWCRSACWAARCRADQRGACASMRIEAYQAARLLMSSSVRLRVITVITSCFRAPLR